MAHLIDTTRIAAGAFYGLRTPAWHKLGTVVDRPADDGDVLRLAGLDWTPTLRPMWTSDTDGNPVAITDKRAVVRSDTGQPVGVVGTGYNVVPNDALMDAIRRIDSADGAIIETAGCLDGGKAVWLMMRHERFSFTVGKDASHGYLLLTNRHDGTETLRVLPTTIRVVCANTLGAALSNGRSSGHFLRHSVGVLGALSEVADQYNRAVRDADRLRESMEALAKVRSSTDSLEAIMRTPWEVTADTLADESDRAKTIREARESRIRRIRASETCDVEGTAGTLFSDLQAVTEYVDHHWRGPQSALFGGGSDLKATALETALALV